MIEVIILFRKNGEDDKQIRNKNDSKRPRNYFLLTVKNVANGKVMYIIGNFRLSLYTSVYY